MVKPKEKTYTEVEQVAILNEVLRNKDLLENPEIDRRDKRKAEKWTEIAERIDAYFGTTRGATKTRQLYQGWKMNVMRKYKKIKVVPGKELEFEATLTAADRVFRRILPNIFPIVKSDVKMRANGNSNKEANGQSKEDENKDSDEESEEAAEEESSEKEEDEEEQPPENSESSHEETSEGDEKGIEDSKVSAGAAKTSEDAEQSVDQASSDANEEKDVQPDESEELALSLKSIDIQINAAEPNDEKISGPEEKKGKAGKKITGGEKPLDLSGNDESADKKKVDEEKMEEATNDAASNEVADEENPDTELPGIESSSAANTEGVVKRKKKQQAKTVKKRKTAK